MRTHKIIFHAHSDNSFFAKTIKFWTLSEYNHISIQLGSTVYEALVKEGVVKTSNIKKPNPSIKLSVDIPVTLDTYNNFKAFLEGRVGNRYDLIAIFGFARNKYYQDDTKDFCSELSNYFWNFEIPEYKELNKKLISPQIFMSRVLFYRQGLYNDLSN